MPRNPAFGAIDVGSNGIRLLIAEVGGGKIRRLHAERVPIRLGHDVFARGRIHRDNLKRSIAALTRFHKLAGKHKVGRVTAVATSAVREARNGRLLVRGVREATGMPLRVITGDEEARLVHLAVRRHVDLRGKTALLIDIGGGSVELALSRDGVVLATESFALGTVRLLHEMKKGRLETAYIDGHIRSFLRRARRRHRGAIDLCVGTGGNIECLGKLRVRMLGRKSEDKLRRRELDRLAAALEKMTHRARERTLGLRRDRADVIAPAALVLRRLMKLSGMERLTIPHVGLRHGLLLDRAKPRAARRAA